MGLEFFQSSPAAKAIFEQADKICANDLTKVMFEGPEEKLTSTAYCQPAILTMSMAALKAFEAHEKYKNISVKFTAGLSLGEYSALAASGVMNFADTLRLVQKRAAFMEEAAKENQGAMAAVIGFDKDKLVEICRQTGVQIANFNSHEQIVITGLQAKVDAAIEAIKAAGGKKLFPCCERRFSFFVDGFGCVKIRGHFKRCCHKPINYSCTEQCYCPTPWGCSADPYEFSQADHRLGPMGQMCRVYCFSGNYRFYRNRSRQGPQRSYPAY